MDFRCPLRPMWQWLGPQSGVSGGGGIFERDSRVSLGHWKCIQRVSQLNYSPSPLFSGSAVDFSFLLLFFLFCCVLPQLRSQTMWSTDHWWEPQKKLSQKETFLYQLFRCSGGELSDTVTLTFWAAKFWFCFCYHILILK